MMLADVALNLQDAAIAALLFMVSFSGMLLKIQWDRQTACEKRDAETQKELRLMSNKVGILKGMLDVMKFCPIANCPYRPHIPPLDEEAQKLPEWPTQH